MWRKTLRVLRQLPFRANSDADGTLVFKTEFGRKIDSMAGKVVWITGASSGIGEYMAYCFAEGGSRLVISARRKEELERVKQACLTKEFKVRKVLKIGSASHGAQQDKTGRGKITEADILVLPLDVVAYDAHKPAVQTVLETFNKIDVLVNNAGRSQRAAWTDVALDVDRDLFEINVLGTVSLTQEVLPHMIQRKEGQIAVMSSIAGKMGLACSRSYTGTKHALHGYFECLRMEMAENNIDITLLCPGPTFSQLFIKAATSKPGEDLGRVMDETEKRMSTERCAYLSCVAITNRLYEAWICQQPILSMLYRLQYSPDMGRGYMVRNGLKQMMKLREGK